MHNFDATSVRCFFGDVEWPHRQHLSPWSGRGCRRHHRHVEGERATGGTARPWEPAPHGFTWLTLALAFSPFVLPGYMLD
jgi:hypothetical protein